MKKQHNSIQINEARLASKDNELIKTHSVIDKLNKEELTVTIRESELKSAGRFGVLEEEDTEPPYKLVKEIETFKLQLQLSYSYTEISNNRNNPGK